MDKKNTPDIVLQYPTEFPEELIEKELLSIYEHKLNLKYFKEEPKKFMAFEWVMPTLFGIYILKPYFSAFLTEAGKDHYQILKNGLKKIIEKGKIITAKTIAASNSTEKLSKKYNQSLVISLTIQTKSNKQIKLLFNNDLDKSDWDTAIDELLDFVIENYESFPEDKLSQSLNRINTRDTETIYGMMNSDTKKLEFYNDEDLIKKFK